MKPQKVSPVVVVVVVAGFVLFLGSIFLLVASASKLPDVTSSSPALPKQPQDEDARTKSEASDETTYYLGAADFDGRRQVATPTTTTRQTSSQQMIAGEFLLSIWCAIIHLIIVLARIRRS